MLSISQRFEQACNYIKSQLIIKAPFDTGNLALNSIRIIFDKGVASIVIGGEAAPYAIYTNEKWNGRKNPNEGWIERTIEESKPMIISIMRGSISQDDYEREVAKQKSLIDIRLKRRVERLRAQEQKLYNRWAGLYDV